MSKRLITIFLLISSISLVLNIPAPASFFFGLVQAFFLPGFVLLFFLRDGRRHWFGDLALAPLLSPIILTFSTLLLLGVTGSIERALRISLFITYFFLGLSIFMRKENKISIKSDLPKTIPFICLLFGGLVAVSYMINPDLMKQSDAWYHASVISEILSRGVPPMEPLLADFPIKYMWFYHFFIASLIKLSRLPLFPAMAAFNIMAAFSFPYLIAKFASFFTKKTRNLTIVILLTLAGLGSVSWVLWPVRLGRALFGEVTKMDEFARSLTNIDLNSANVVYTLAPYGTHMVNLLDKFLTVTVFGYSLNLFLLSVLTIFLSEREGRLKPGGFILLFLGVFGATLFHIVTGAALLCTITGMSILSFLAYRFLHMGKATLGFSSLVVLTGILALVLAVPFLNRMNMNSGSESGNFLAQYLHFSFLNTFTILAPLLLLFAATRNAIRGLFTKERIAILCCILPLLILSVFVNLPSVNESKFIFPLFLIIGPPIFAEIVLMIRNRHGSKKRGLILIMIFLFLPAPFLTLRGFLITKPESDMEIRRLSIDDQDKAVFEWIREKTAKDAVFIENNRNHLIPVYAGRRNFYSDFGIIHVLGYNQERLSRYKKIRDELFSQDPVSAESIEYLKNVGFDIYLTVWENESSAFPYLAKKFVETPEWFSLEYKDTKAELYRLNSGED